MKKLASDYNDGRLQILSGPGVVMLDGRAIRLTPMEYSLLCQFAANAWQPVYRHDALRHLWGYPPGLGSRTVDVHVRRLRMKLGDY